MLDAIETYELRGVTVRVLVDESPENPRTEYDGEVLRLVPLEVLESDGDGARGLSAHLRSLGFDGADELAGLWQAWDKLGGESGEVHRLTDAPGWVWETVPGWPALADFGATPVARWARIFHGVELETVEAGENLAVAWIDPELVAQYGAPLYEDRAGALSMIASSLAPYNAWAAGDVYGVEVQGKGADEAVWGFYFLEGVGEAAALAEALDIVGRASRAGRRISERLEVVRELDALRKRLHRAESRERWERQRGEARVIEARAASKVEGLRVGLRAVDALASGRGSLDEIREALEREIGRLAPLEAAGRRDVERAAGYLAGLSR